MRPAWREEPALLIGSCSPLQLPIGAAVRLRSWLAFQRGRYESSNAIRLCLASCQLLKNPCGKRMEKMTKQFGKSMLSVIGLAVAAAVLSSVPVQAQNVIAHSFDAGIGWFNSDFSELYTATAVRTNSGYMLSYNIFDFGGGISAGGSGPISASSVNISGGSVNSAKVTVTLNTDTCALNFPNSYGLCGPINVSWVELPASVGGSIANHGDSRNLFPGGGVVTNGSTVTFFASASGTILGSDVPQGAVGNLTQGTNITRTITGP